MNKEFKGIMVVTILLTALITAGVMYWWEQRTPETAPTVTPTTTPARVASLDVNIENENFANFSTAIDANGSVSSDTDKSTNITIWNNDTIDSASLYLTLYNTQTGEYGLPDALQIDEVAVKITYSNNFQTVTKYLFKDGKFNPIRIGTLESDAYATIQITVSVEQSDDSTFVDGKTYNCEFYILQGSTSYDYVNWHFLT